MKTNKLASLGKLSLLFLLVANLSLIPSRALASGGSGSGSGSGSATGSGGGSGTTSTTDTLKVNKCYYAPVVGYVELLLQAVSSDSNAHIYAYLPDGTYLGEVQNGGGGRYGGTVLGCYYVPSSITFISSSGGSITVPTSLMQL
jgi:hypothetical protein